MIGSKNEEANEVGLGAETFCERAGWIITAQICTNSFTPSNLMYALALSGHGDLYQGSVHSAKAVSFFLLNACTVIFARDLGIHPFPRSRISLYGSWRSLRDKQLSKQVALI